MINYEWSVGSCIWRAEREAGPWASSGTDAAITLSLLVSGGEASLRTGKNEYVHARKMRTVWQNEVSAADGTNCATATSIGLYKDFQVVDQVRRFFHRSKSVVQCKVVGTVFVLCDASVSDRRVLWPTDWRKEASARPDYYCCIHRQQRTMSKELTHWRTKAEAN